MRGKRAQQWSVWPDDVDPKEWTPQWLPAQRGNKVRQMHCPQSKWWPQVNPRKCNVIVGMGEEGYWTDWNLIFNTQRNGNSNEKVAISLILRSHRLQNASLICTTTKKKRCQLIYKIMLSHHLQFLFYTCWKSSSRFITYHSCVYTKS